MCVSAEAGSEQERHTPALRIRRLSSLDLSASHPLVLSQSSFPQQHVRGIEGSGEGTREWLVKASVRSSIVVVAWYRLLALGESGVGGHESARSLRIVRC